MTLPEILQFVSVGCAIVAAGCAMLAARRAGQWRESDAAQQLLGRVAAVERKVNDAALDIIRVERETGLKLDAIKNEIDDLATKEDVAKVKGAVDTTCAIANRTELAVNRLQEFLMQSGRV